MIETVVHAVGLVLIVEGLVLALAPSRIEEALVYLASLPAETRRLIGFLALVGGVAILALARSLGS